MVTACSDQDSIQKVRRSIAFGLFFVYATYLIGLLLSHITKDQSRKKNLRRYAQDTAYKTVFFTIFAILARSAAPYVLQSVFIYLYFAVSVVTFFGYFSDSQGLRTIGVIFQPITVVVFALSVLIDDWCSLFY